VVRFGDGVAGLGWHGEKEERADWWGPHVSERKREKALLLECTNPKRRYHLANAPRRRRPMGEVGQCGGTGPAGLDCSRRFKGKFIFEFQMNWDLGKTLRNFTRRFRRNMDMKFFSKFFYASHGFLENTICCAMNATLF
jgi:hypothetical protein